MVRKQSIRVALVVVVRGRLGWRRAAPAGTVRPRHPLAHWAKPNRCGRSRAGYHGRLLEPLEQQQNRHSISRNRNRWAAGGTPDN